MMESIHKMIQTALTCDESLHVSQWEMVYRVRCNDKQPLSRHWNAGSGVKIIGHKISEKMAPQNTVILGGICTLYGDSVLIRKGERVFKTICEFEEWLCSWYPRLDQIHNTVGCPPCSATQIIYVCEDSLFARRIAKWTCLPEKEVSQVIQRVHTSCGHPLIVKWLKMHGYRGDVKVVYTSDIDDKLDFAVRVLERVTGRSLMKNRDAVSVMLMYTALWVDILQCNKQAVIYEPADHMVLESSFRSLAPWLQQNPYAEEGYNHDLGIIGFLPFWSQNGNTRLLTMDNVPHRGNWQDFILSPDDIEWYVGNVLFTFYKKDQLENLTQEEKEKQIRSVIKELYGTF